MALITAAEARAMTVSRDKKISTHIAKWQENFNIAIEKAAKGIGKNAGETSLFFEISAGNSLMLEAKEIFLSEVRGAKYNVRLHDSSDENDYFVYEVDWS